MCYNAAETIDMLTPNTTMMTMAISRMTRRMETVMPAIACEDKGGQQSSGHVVQVSPMFSVQILSPHTVEMLIYFSVCLLINWYLPL